MTILERRMRRLALVAIVLGLCASVSTGCATTQRRKIMAADGSKLVETEQKDGRTRRRGLETREGRTLLPTRFDRVIALSSRFAIGCILTNHVMDCDLIDLGSRKTVRRFEYVKVIDIRRQGALVLDWNAWGHAANRGSPTPGRVALLGPSGIEWEVDKAIPSLHPRQSYATYRESAPRDALPRHALVQPRQPLVLLQFADRVELRGRAASPIATFAAPDAVEWFFVGIWTFAAVKDAAGWHLHDGERFHLRDGAGRPEALQTSGTTELAIVPVADGYEVLNPVEPDAVRPVVRPVWGPPAEITSDWYHDQIKHEVRGLLVRVDDGTGARWGLTSGHGQWLTEPSWIDVELRVAKDNGWRRALFVGRSDAGWQAFGIDGRPVLAQSFPTPDAASEAVGQDHVRQRTEAAARREQERAEQQRARFASFVTDYDAAVARKDWKQAGDHADLAMRFLMDAYHRDAALRLLRARRTQFGEKAAAMAGVRWTDAARYRALAETAYGQEATRERGELLRYFILVEHASGNPSRTAISAETKRIDPTDRYGALAVAVEAHVKQAKELERQRRETASPTYSASSGGARSGGSVSVSYPDYSFQRTSERFATQMRDWNRAFNYATSSHAWNWRR